MGYGTSTCALFSSWWVIIPPTPFCLGPVENNPLLYKLPVIEKVIFHSSIFLLTHNFKKIPNKRKSEKNPLVFQMAEKHLLESQWVTATAGKGKPGLSMHLSPVRSSQIQDVWSVLCCSPPLCLSILLRAAATAVVRGFAGCFKNQMRLCLLHCVTYTAEHESYSH